MRRRSNKLTKHHLLAEARGGNNRPENILFLKREKHDTWHTLFGNMSLEEAINLLQRTKRMKDALKHKGY